ncbi:MAG: baseplate J/gp47 family protein, partial [Spirochaetota bacterium]
MALKDIKLHSEILSELATSFIARQDKISDLNTGSTIHDILYLFSLAMEDVYLKISLELGDIPLELAEGIFNFKRKTGEYASGEVEFKLKKVAAVNVTIPKGTKVNAANGSEYKTTQDLVILKGVQKGQVAVVALKKDTLSNVGIGDVSVLSQSIDTVETVTNKLPITGGKEQET